MQGGNAKSKAAVLAVAMLFFSLAIVSTVNPTSLEYHYLLVKRGNIVKVIPVPPGMQQQGQQSQGQGQQSDEGGNPGPCMTLSPTYADLGMYSIRSPEWITYSFNVTNTGSGMLSWQIEEFPSWISYITINGQQGYGASCDPGQTKIFTIHIYTGNLEDPYVTDNLYNGMVNLTSNANNAGITATIDMVDPEYPGHALWDFLFPSELQPGDMLFMDARPWVIDHIGVPWSQGEHNDHVILYYEYKFGVHYFIEANNYTIYSEHLGNFTFPHKSGVFKTAWWVFCFWGTNFSIGKVNGATAIQTRKAREIAYNISQKPYIKYQSGYPNVPPYEPICNPNITDASNPYYNGYLWLEDPGINSYFCAELVWASYLQVKPPINIDHFPEHYTNWVYDHGTKHHLGVTLGPNTLLESQNITFTDLNEYEYNPR
jgi:hypothetical protein